MAERSFVEEVKKLRLGAGEVFRGEGILAVTKALLESGVSYVAGYQGAPISHLMDVLADAQDILAEHGIRFENSASEATAAATLAASVNYPMRGAVTFKGPVGVNVASDALANSRRAAVTGGALVIVGEDYGEGSSIMQERSHAFAMKSQIWLLDPRPNLPSIVKAVKDGFELSEASHTPVMLMLRIRACHVHGHFVAGAKPDRRVHDRRRGRRAAPRHRADRAAAGDLRPRAGEDPRALAGGGALHRGARPQRILRRRRRGSSASSSRAATTTRCCARSNGSASPTPTAARRSRST
jgi:TPP-dependent indolepyruvate ferredoxin oxidoreductase alpha subunit